MDPKQTSPLGNAPAGGQEGQSGQPAVPQPVFGTGDASANAAGSAPNAAEQKIAGTLGAENLSTGANVSRTMDSLNSKNQSATGTSVFSKHKFDKVEPDGAIILPGSPGPAMVEKRGMSFKTKLKIGIGIGGVVAVGLIVAIIFAFVNAPKKETTNKAATVVETELDSAALFDRCIEYFTFGENSPESEDSLGVQVLNFFGTQPFSQAVANEIVESEPIEISYTNKLNEYYNAFREAYSGPISNDSLIYISVYYYNYANSVSLTENEITHLYVDNGKESAISDIEATLEENQDSFNISRYNYLKKQYLLAYVEILEQAAANDCIDENYVVSSQCDITTYNSYDNYKNNLDQFNSEKQNLVDSMQENAENVVESLISEFYADMGSSVLDAQNSESSDIDVRELSDSGVGI